MRSEGMHVQVPPELAALIEEEAAREGLTPAELGELLLYAGAAVLLELVADGEALPGPLGRFLEAFAATQPDAPAAGVLRERALPYGVRPSRPARSGDRARLRRLLARLHPSPGQTMTPTPPPPQPRPSAMGKYAHLRAGSEELALEKQREIEREERRLR